MEQEILNQIAEKEGYADWHELTEQNDPNTIYEYTLKALNQALSIANVSERFFINIYQDEDGKFISDEEYVSFADAQENRDEVWTYIETVEVIRNAR